MAACIVGIVIVIVHIPAVFAPNHFRRALLAVPRSRWPGWALTLVDLAWVSWVIYHASLGRFEFMKPWLYVAAPVSFLLIVFFMDELLAPRAFGGLLLLVANPVLNAARWHDSNWRWVMAFIAYVWVIGGIMLVLSPYRFRQIAEVASKTELRCRLGGALRMAVGTLLVILGLTVY
mgnify:CR=1 FL=1